MKRKRAEDLFSAMTEIDEKYIEEAENYSTESNVVTAHPGRKRWVAIAACFVLIMAVAFPALSNLFNKTTNMKAASDFADTQAEQAVDGAYGSEKSMASNNANDEAECRISNVPDDVSINCAVPDDGELSFEVIGTDLASTEQYITVRWTNRTAHDVKISPAFSIMKQGENGKYENALPEDVTMAFPTVLYTAEKDGGTCDIKYNVPHLNELGSEQIVLFLNTYDEGPYRIDIDFGKNQ